MRLAVMRYNAEEKLDGREAYKYIEDYKETSNAYAKEVYFNIKEE